MKQKNSLTRTKMSHKQITSKERTELAILLRAGLKQKEIAKTLNKHKSTILRELKRNTREDGKYDARIAKEKVKKRRLENNQRFRKITNNFNLKRYIVEKIRKYWSPEQVAGRLKLINGRSIIHHETIYRFIYNEYPELKKYLRCQKGKYKKRYGTRKREKEREEAKIRRIDKRPEIVEKRGRVGDWEGDTIRGKGRKSAILTHVDRKSRYLIANKLDRALAEKTRKITIDTFKDIPRKKRHTITYDNGSEFAEYEFIERDTQMTVYFAYPYHSWERGTNENTNGLLRQFYPKKTEFRTIKQETLDKVVYLINNRPRKRLYYKTPYEIFMTSCISD